MERPTKAAWWRKRGEEGDARVGESCEVSLGRSFETRGEGAQARWANCQHWRVTDYEGAAGGALRFARRLCAGDSTGAGIIYSTAAVLLLYSNRGHGMLSALSGLRWV